MSIFESETEKTKKGHFMNLMNVAMADGELDQREMELIFKIGFRIGLSEKQMKAVIRAPEKCSFIPPSTPKLRRALLRDYVWVMVVDGKIEDEEVDLCYALAYQLDLDPVALIPKIIEEFLPEMSPSSSVPSTRSHEGITIDSEAFLSDTSSSFTGPAPTRSRRQEPSNDRENERDDEIRIGDFAVSIEGGTKSKGDYFLLRHGQNYSVSLRNYSSLRCDADMEIDGKDMGTFRVKAESISSFERPAHEDGKLTFFEVMSDEGNAAGLKINQKLGLVSVTFRPEMPMPLSRTLAAAEPIDASGDLFGIERTPIGEDVLFAPRPSNEAPIPRAGGTGLSGQSDQELIDAEEIEHDPHATVVINLRLGAEIAKAPEKPRPLTSHPRSNEIPPPLT